MPPFSSNHIIFINNTTDTRMGRMVGDYYNEFNALLNGRSMELVYFPWYIEQVDFESSEVREAVQYSIPSLYNMEFAIFQQLRQTIVDADFYSYIRTLLGNNEPSCPYFLHFSKKNNEFGVEIIRTYPLEEYYTHSDITDLLGSIEQFQHSSNNYHSSKSLDSLTDNSDSFKRIDIQFEIANIEEHRHVQFEIAKIDEQLNKIKSKSGHVAIAELVLRMLYELKTEKPELIKRLKPIIENTGLLEAQIPLSPLLIDRNYRMFLPAYGNLEIKMHALPKTVYLFFLRYPKGVRFKELYLYKNELLSIYNKVTNKNEPSEIEKAIDDLVDVCNPSIQQKCARIREAFRLHVDEHIARNYYVQGANGEPKSVSLPQSMIQYRS